MDAFVFNYGQLANFTPGAEGFGEWEDWEFFRDQIETKTRYAELRYTGSYDFNDNAVLDYIVSAEHYFNEVIGADVGSNFDALPDTFSLANPQYTGSDPFNVPTNTLNDVFVDNDAQINSISFLFSLDLYDRLRLNGGIRHDQYRGRENLTVPADLETFKRGTQSYSASIAYDVTEEFTAYYAYSDGFEFVNALDCNGDVTPSRTTGQYRHY